MLRGRYRFLSLALVALMSMALLVACSDDDGDGEGTPDLPETTSTAEAPDTTETPESDETPEGTETPEGDETPEGTETPEGNGGTGGGSTSLSLAFQDIAFSETELSIPANEEVTLDITNEGVLEHDISIDSIPVEYELSGDAEDGDDWDLHASLAAGSSGAVVMTVSEPGEYVYYCSVPGHREAGMEGTLTVE